MFYCNEISETTRDAYDVNETCLKVYKGYDRPKINIQTHKKHSKPYRLLRRRLIESMRNVLN